ncbi:lytic transglycosylase domain-containing protein [Acidithiobacillus sp. MC6.1]|nr:lytic transglycosylase domain-containing protein [Acidithiobacillus sp. MC6.1]
MRCIQSAAHRYGLTLPILISVLRTEGGRPGTVAPDPNGTADLGPAQVNTCHLPHLEAYGYTYTQLTDNPCANVAAGAWIFARCLSATGNVLSAAACYNAGGRPWLAWQSGYVQRFARYLGIHGAPVPIDLRTVLPVRKRPQAQLTQQSVDLRQSGGLL